jgi:integrase
MKRPRWPYLLRERTRHGQVSWYVRIEKGPRVRIKAETGTPEFRAEYDAAVSALEKGEKPEVATPGMPVSGTVAWLWEKYRKSSVWASLAKATRRQRENIMAGVLKEGGGAPLSVVNRKMIIDGRERRRDTPSQANNYLNTMRHLFAWAVDDEVLKVDPTEGVKNVKRPKTDGFPDWTEEDCAKFEAMYPLGTRERVAYSVFLYAGLRRGDAAALCRQHIRKGVISLKTEKTDTPLTVPVHPELVKAINACPPKGLFIIETAHGRGWVKESLGNWMHDLARAAGIDKSAHGLRKAAAARVAEAGASEAQLMALFGWTDPAMARLYTKKANARKLALQASKMDGVSEVVDLFPTQDAVGFDKNES